MVSNDDHLNFILIFLSKFSAWFFFLYFFISLFSFILFIFGREEVRLWKECSFFWGSSSIGCGYLMPFILVRRGKFQLQERSGHFEDYGLNPVWFFLLAKRYRFIEVLKKMSAKKRFSKAIFGHILFPFQEKHIYLEKVIYSVLQLLLILFNFFNFNFLCLFFCWRNKNRGVGRRLWMQLRKVTHG